MTPRTLPLVGTPGLYYGSADETPPPKSGRIDGVPLATYHSWSAWGSSDLKAMRQGPPALVPWRRANPTPDTDATKLGTWAHAKILEPVRFAAAFAHKPAGMTFASTEGKDWKKARFAEGYAENAIIPHESWVAVEKIEQAFRGKALASLSLKKAEGVEASFVAEDPESGETVKARPDWFGGGFIYDLKISRYAVARSLAFNAYVAGWMHQLAYYRAVLSLCGETVDGGRLVVIAPKEPHHLAIYCVEVKPDALDLLGIENARTLLSLRECRVSGCWRSTPDEWTKVEPPPAALASLVDLTGIEEE